MPTSMHIFTEAIELIEYLTEYHINNVLIHVIKQLTNPII